MEVFFFALQGAENSLCSLNYNIFLCIYIHNSACVILHTLLCTPLRKIILGRAALVGIEPLPSPCWHFDHPTELPFSFQTKLPTFASSLSFLSFICLLNSLLPPGIGEVSKFGFCVPYKRRQPADRNVNQCKSIMKAIYELCEE